MARAMFEPVYKDIFPFWDVIITKKLRIINTNPIDVALFGLYCMTIGVFEECIFRGIVFSVLAGVFSNDKKGFIKTYVVSSLIFGAAHLFNGFSLGTIFQIGYTTLTGGLFAFAFIKTKNIFCAAFVHAVYNFCGLIWTQNYLGNGVAFGLGTAVTMLIICVSVGAFVLYCVWNYPEEEREELYALLGVLKEHKE